MDECVSGLPHHRVPGGCDFTEFQLADVQTLVALEAPESQAPHPGLRGARPSAGVPDEADTSQGDARLDRNTNVERRGGSIEILPLDVLVVISSPRGRGRRPGWPRANGTR